MIEVVTAGRLHFGLLQPGAAEPGGRRFGGAGMMIERPGVRLRVEPADAWMAEGPLAERALSFARRFCQSLAAAKGQAVSPQHLTVEAAPPEHAGLGSGTQLGLAVAKALALAVGQSDLSLSDLARFVGRGARSGIGIHGFERGGFLVDAGQGEEGGLAPLVARARVPETWRIVLVLPEGEAWHGLREQKVFEELLAPPPTICDRLCRLVLLGLLPALAEADLEGFGESLYEFNTLAGQAFSPLQGGTYASARTAEVVTFLRGLGVKGTGQSSWGPAVFALVGREEAGLLTGRIRDRFGLDANQVLLTRPVNRGAEWTRA